MRSEEHQQSVATLLTVFVPCVEVMRLVDGKKGVTLGKFYAAMLELGGESGLYAGRISGVNGPVRKKMHKVSKPVGIFPQSTHDCCLHA